MCNSTVEIKKMEKGYSVNIDGPGEFHYTKVVLDRPPEGMDERLLRMVDAYIYTNRKLGDRAFPGLRKVLDIVIF